MSNKNIRILSEEISYRELLSTSKQLKIAGIYKIENLINHKVYIGQSYNIVKRLRGHVSDEGNKHLRSSFEKYGLDSFSFEIIKQTYDLDYWEIFLIQMYRATDSKYGYNISIGGNGGNMGEKWRNCLLEAINTEEYHETLRQSQRKRWESEDEHLRYSELTANVWKDPELRKKRIESQKGHRCSEETKRKIGESNRKRMLSKHLHWYNNGVESKLCKQCPDGWKEGKIGKKGINARAKTELEKQKLSKHFTGLIWWNNGETQIQSRVQPEGFVRGKLPKNMKLHWYNNGVDNVMSDVCPEGYVSGRIIKNKNRKKTYFFNNGVINIRCETCPEGFVPGMLPRGSFTEEHKRKLSESHKKSNKSKKLNNLL